MPANATHLPATLPTYHQRVAPRSPLPRPRPPTTMVVSAKRPTPPDGYGGGRSPCGRATTTPLWRDSPLRAPLVEAKRTSIRSPIYEYTPLASESLTVNLTGPARTSDFRGGSIENLKKSARGYPPGLALARWGDGGGTLRPTAEECSGLSKAHSMAADRVRKSIRKRRHSNMLFDSACAVGALTRRGSKMSAGVLP
jgi:hypothetical protein